MIRFQGIQPDTDLMEDVVFSITFPMKRQMVVTLDSENSTDLPALRQALSKHIFYGAQNVLLDHADGTTEALTVCPQSLNMDDSSYTITYRIHARADT